jgi:hypothetical protein
MNWIDALGYVASIAVLATFMMGTMISLRLVAIASNLLFIMYGHVAHIAPVLLLHVALLPINIFRLFSLYWVDLPHTLSNCTPPLFRRRFRTSLATAVSDPSARELMHRDRPTNGST